MLYATGLTEEDMNKAQVGICSVWYEGNPCNMHLLDLSEKVKTGVEQVDCVGYRFNTVGVSDGISMGTPGMRYSLQSRDLIADSIETTMGAQWYDGLIALPGCDKNMPGCIMAMGRLNRPGIMVYGGTIRAGKMPSTGAPLDIVSAFQSYGEYAYDRITEEERKEIIKHACPGPGACGGKREKRGLTIRFEHVDCWQCLTPEIYCFVATQECTRQIQWLLLLKLLVCSLEGIRCSVDTCLEEKCLAYTTASHVL